MRRVLFVILVLSSTSYGVSSATIINRVVESLTQLRTKNVSHRWQGRQDWHQWGCSSFWDYQADFFGRVTDVQFDLKSDRWIEFDIQMDPIDLNLDGAYRSPYSLCRRLAAKDGMTIPWATAKTFVQFIETPKISDIKFNLRVVETEFGPFHLKSGKLSTAQERFVTRAANFTFGKVWGSWLGKWIESRLAEEIGKAISSGEHESNPA